MRSWRILPFFIILSVQVAASPAEKRVTGVIRSGSYDSAPYERMRSEVGEFLEQSETAEPSLIATEKLVKKLHTFINQPAMKGESPADRQAVAMKVLGEENYRNLESFFLKQLESEDGERIETAMACLSQCLFSLPARESIRREFEKMSENLGGGSPTESSNPKVLFAAAEALTFLGDPAGLEVLPPFLSADFPKTYRIRAMRALANFDDEVDLLELLVGLLDEQDSDVAYRAIEIVEPRMKDKTALYDPACGQLERLSKKVGSGGTLNLAEQALLSYAARILKQAQKAEAFSPERQTEIKDPARVILVSGTGREPTLIASLFASLATDEDTPIIEKHLLESESPDLRRRGPLALTHCSREVQKKYVPVLLEMLDDEDHSVRNFALYALRTYMGEKAGTDYSAEGFERESARVKRELEKMEK